MARPPSSLARARDPCRPSPRRDRGRRPARCPCPVASGSPAAGHPVELARTAPSSASGTPGPSSSTVSRDAVAVAAVRARIRIGAPGGAYLAAFSSRLVSAWSRKTGSTSDRRQVAGTSIHARRPASRDREPVDDRPDHVVELERLEVGPQRAGLDPAEVEQVRHEPVEVLRLAVDRQRRSRGGPRHHDVPRSSSVPAAARIVASGVRRSCDTDSSRADLSASLWRAISAASRLVGEAILLECLADLVGGGGEQPRLRRGRARRRCGRGRPRPSRSSGRRPRSRTRWARTPAPPARWTPRLVDLDPLRRRVARRAPEQRRG